MKTKTRDIYWLPALVLLFIGGLDLLRGFMHTFLLTWSALNIAKFDPAAPQDQFFLLGVFGISNFLTGFLYLLISRKAREISPYVLILIPLAYLLGVAGIRAGGVQPQAAFEGKYFMLVYFVICVLGFAAFLVRKIGRKA